MKIFLLFIAALFFCDLSIGQSKVNTIYGFTLDPDGKGDRSSISLLGSMENSWKNLYMSFLAASPIDSVVFLMTDSDPSNNKKIILRGATVYALKQYTSTFSNGIFNVSYSGNINTEVKIKFHGMFIMAGSSNTSQTNDPVNPVLKDIANLNPNETSQTEKLNTGTQPWEIFTDNTLTGVTGQLVFEMPTNISYAHLKVFESGDTKMVASLFGNGKSKLIPGNYDLMLDKYSIKNVPIEVGKTTRLKIGRLNYSPRGSVRIVDANKQEFSMGGPFKIALPPGTYYVDGKKEHSFVIKDGEVTEY